MRKDDLGRTPIAPVMRRLNREITSEGSSPQLEDRPAPPTTGTNDERMAAIRPELYAITGILTKLAIDQFIGMQDRYPPYGFVTNTITENAIYGPDELQPKTDSRGLTGLYQGLRNTAQLTVNTLRVPKEYQSTAKRFDLLVRTARNVNSSAQYGSSRRFLLAGLNTAIEMSVGGLAGIFTLARSERPGTTKQEFIDIAGRSSRMATSIAALNVDQMHPLRRAIMSNPGPQWGSSYSDVTSKFNPNLLAFQGDPYDPKASVDFIKPIGKLVDPQTGRRIEEIKPTFETLTCPALARIDEGPAAVRALWNHITQLSVALQPRLK